MAKVTYEILDENTLSFADVERYSSRDLELIENFSINKKFDFSKHYIETHFYSVNNVKLFSTYNYTLPTPTLPSGELEDTISEITLDPAGIANEFGFTRTDIKVLFHFLNDLYSSSNNKKEFYIQSISADRTEVLLYSDKITLNQLISRTGELKENLNSKNYFEEYWLNLGDNDLYITTNIDTFELDNKVCIALKLYEPLPEKYDIKSSAQIVEKVSNSIAVKVLAEIEEEKEVVPKLRDANFAIDTTENSAEPTQYFNFDDLLSYSNNNSNYQIFSEIKSKGVSLGVDYSNYEDFIHFSSAEERLRNFIYKKTLLETYEEDLRDQQSTNNTTVTARSGSIVATENLIRGIIDNFDHYERHLYFESGSTSWPKAAPGDVVNGETIVEGKPYTNRSVNHTTSVSFVESQLNKAQIYDSKNYDRLINFLPEYTKEDVRFTRTYDPTGASKTNQAMVFTDMLGHHYDNLWLYSKAMTNKYNTDHRLDFGLSKSIVQEAVKSMGIKVYNSIEGQENLFDYFIQSTYDSGSIDENISNFQTTSNTKYSRQDYESEIYKRVYHNVPEILKSKGTERGLRALVNSFGIPELTGLNISTYGDSFTNSASSAKFGEETEFIDRRQTISIAPSGSGTHDGYVLSKDTSIQLEKRINANSKRVNRVDVGYSPSYHINLRIGLYFAQIGVADFNIDDFIGDPRDLNKHEYESLTVDGTDRKLDKILEAAITSYNSTQVPFNAKEFVRLFKFLDNSLFKMVKDYLPVRAVKTAGMVFKQLALEKNKIKSPAVTGTNEILTGSIDTAFITGSHGGAFVEHPLPSDAKHHTVTFSNLAELNGKFSPGRVGGMADLNFNLNFNPSTRLGEAGAIVPQGDILYHPNGDIFNLEEFTTSGVRKHIGTPFNSTNKSFLYIMHSSESIKARFPNLDTATGHPSSSHDTTHHDHLIAVFYDTTAGTWKAQAKQSFSSASFNPLSSDLILVAMTEDASGGGIAALSSRYFKPLNGFVNLAPVSASMTITFSNDSATAGSDMFHITSSDGTKKKYGAISSGVNGAINSGTVTFLAAGGSYASSFNKASNFAAALTSSNGHNGKIIPQVVTANDTSSVILVQNVAGEAGNNNFTLGANALTNNVVDLAPFPFEGGEDASRTFERFHDNTFHRQIYKSLTGSVDKLVDDDSPKFNGELSGSDIVVTDGELNAGNVFKAIQSTATKFNISTINQSTADLLESILMMNTGNNPTLYSTGSVACAAVLLSDTRNFFHDGTAATPVNGNELFYDINGDDDVNGVGSGGAGSFVAFLVDTSTTNVPNYVSFTAELESNGTLTNITSCSSIDSTAPASYSASYSTPLINSGNVTAVPFSVINMEVGAELFVTASDQSGNEVKQSYGTGNGTAGSFSINCTTLTDGDTIDLNVKMRDGAQNTGSTAPEIGEELNGTPLYGLSIVKNASGPTGYTADFVIAEHTNLGTVGMTQSANYTAAYEVEVKGFSDHFSGTISVTFSSSYAGAQTHTKTTTITSGAYATPGTASVVHNDGNSQGSGTLFKFSNTGSATGYFQSNVGNTVNALVTLTDTFGNTGPTVSASVPYYPHIFYWINPNQSNPVTAFDVGTNSNTYANWQIFSKGFSAVMTASMVSSSQGWITSSLITNGPNYSQAPYAGNSGQFSFTVTQNTDATSGRSATVSLSRKNEQDNFTYEFSGNIFQTQNLTINQPAAQACIDPETEILMKTGRTKKAKNIKVGDVIRSYHEFSHELLEDIVIQVTSHENANKLMIEFENGNLICSDKHRVYLDSTQKYVPVNTLKVNDIISGKVIESISSYGEGKVIELGTEKTHTYISNGVLSHNNKTVRNNGGQGFAP